MRSTGGWSAEGQPSTATTTTSPTDHRPQGDEMIAQRVRRADRLGQAQEFIEHSDELEARAERQTDEVAVARLEGQVQGWREAAARLRTRRT